MSDISLGKVKENYPTFSSTVQQQNSDYAESFHSTPVKQNTTDSVHSTSVKQNNSNLSSPPVSASVQLNKTDSISSSVYNETLQLHTTSGKNETLDHVNKISSKHLPFTTKSLNITIVTS